MIKSLMISKQPQQAVNLLNGNATLDLRTWIPKDYVGWVYVYITKNEPYLIWNNGNYVLYTPKINLAPYSLNGKVAFRFWFDEYIELEHYDFWGESYYWKNTVLSAFELEKATCVSSLEMEEYAKGKTLYAWHIKKLEIFDEPKELSDFYTAPHFKLNNFTTESIEGFDDWLRLKKAPRNRTWVYTKELENEKENV